MQKKIIIPLPLFDFDPTETGIPWKILTQNHIEVVFATSSGQIAMTDLRMLDGRDLGIFKPLLQADQNGQNAFSEMAHSKNFNQPIKWSDIKASDYDGIILPGGHAEGIKEYLESTVLQKIIPDFFSSSKIVGAICHGVVLLARSKNSDGKSVLFEKKTTALLAKQELTAWSLTCLWLKNYYRTYPETVESEVKRNLKDQSNFIKGPPTLLRDDPTHLKRGFVVEDGNYLSARWPGDVHRFAIEFIKKLSDSV